MNRLPVRFVLFGSLLLPSCLRELPPTAPFRTYQPVELHDGWTLARPEDEGINADSLTSIYRELQNDSKKYWMARSMSVFRNGKLVAESFFKDDADRTSQRPVWSCTKSVIGLLVGIAVDRGLIASVDDPLSRYLGPELTQHPDKQAITIR